jgi:hypothetical protein
MIKLFTFQLKSEQESMDICTYVVMHTDEALAKLAVAKQAGVDVEDVYRTGRNVLGDVLTFQN